MQPNKMTRQQKLSILRNYAAGKREEKEIDYSNFTDEELRFIGALQDKLESNDSFTDDEVAEIKRLEKKIIFQ